MASIRKIKNSPYWIARITTADGRRTDKSTKATDGHVARQIASEWERAARRARQGQLIEAQARKVVNDILELSGNDPLPAATVEEFLADWLKGKDNEGTQKRYKGTVDSFTRSLGNRAKQSIAKVTYKDVLSYIASRQSERLSQKTILVDAKILNGAFNSARRLQLVATNPVEKALELEPIHAEESSRCAFDVAQVKAILSKADNEWKTAILIGYTTGARITDCSRMSWDNINLEKQLITFTPHKTKRTKKQVTVPIHPDLMKHLLSLPSYDTGEKQLCPTLCRKTTKGNYGLSESFKRIMVSAGVDPQEMQGDGKRRKSKLSFHSLRHSFTTILANEGVHQETRMAMAGSSSITINNDYTHLDLPKFKAAIYKLPSVLE